MRDLSRFGYVVVPIKASGRRGERRTDLRTIAADVLAFCPDDAWPHLQLEIGGAGKRLGTAFRELRALVLPGFVPIVVRFVERKQWLYVDEDTRVRKYDDLIAAVRDR